MVPQNNINGGCSCLITLNEDQSSDKIDDYSCHVLSEYFLVSGETKDKRIHMPEDVQQGIGFIKRFTGIGLESAKHLQHCNTG